MTIKFKRLTSLVLSLVMVAAMLAPAAICVPASAAESTGALKQKIANLDEKIQASQEQINKNKKKESEAKSSIDSLQSDVDALQTQISAYNEKIDALNDQISAVNTEISNTQTDIAKTEAKISKQKEKIADTQKMLGERLSAMYITGNVSNLEILLEANSFENFLNRLELISRIGKHDNAIISKLKSETADVEASQEKLQQYESSLQANKQTIQSSKTQQQEAKSEIESKKSTLDSKVNSLNGYIDGLESDSAELQSYIKEAEAQKQAYANAINAQLAQTSSTGTGTYISASTGDGSHSGSMTWPVPSSHTVSSGYGPRSGVGVSNFHYGIDITAPAGAAVVAAGSGTVVIASNACSHNYPKNYNCGCNGGYGNYVVIDHGNGLLSYYAHLTAAIVGVGQVVAEGQQIGTLGCTGYSTGNHCHFEIRVNDGSSRAVAARNPMNYVS